jgi:hypothetical protein
MLEGKFAGIYLPSFSLLPTLAANFPASLAENSDAGKNLNPD